MKLKKIDLPGRPSARAPVKGKPFRLAVKAFRDGYEIAIYGDISCDEDSARGFRDELTRAGGDPVTLLINSDGGDIFEGLSIYNEMLAYPGEITVRIMSMAGSAASIIAMGGDRVEMAPTAQMMVHQAWVGCQGNAEDLRALVPTLEQIDASMVEVYVARTGQPREMIEGLVKAESYLTAQRCVELGFADEIVSSPGRGMMAKIDYSAIRKRAARTKLNRIAARSLQVR